MYETVPPVYVRVYVCSPYSRDSSQNSTQISPLTYRPTVSPTSHPRPGRVVHGVYVIQSPRSNKLYTTTGVELGHRSSTGGCESGGNDTTSGVFELGNETVRVTDGDHGWSIRVNCVGSLISLT